MQDGFAGGDKIVVVSLNEYSEGIVGYGHVHQIPAVAKVGRSEVDFEKFGFNIIREIDIEIYRLIYTFRFSDETKPFSHN